VVHRDIKPSNLMVDRHGKLWVTDFGLARFGAGLEITRAGELLGTVRYMSPEQASGASHLVDHRTDIYSLAATLYELLTLRPVFEGTDRQQVIRQIESSEPRAPRSLNRAISVDLETILIKALAKSRDDRYRSAGDLAADLRRVLEGRPAQARRLTVLDRAARYAVRHSRRVLIGTAALTIALAGISVTAVLFARQNSRLAEAQQRATLHLETAQRVVNRFDTQLAEQLDGLPGAETVRSELLRDALEYHRSFLAYAAQDPALKQDLANTHHKIAKVLERLGQSDAALRAYADARDRYLELSRRLPAEFQHAADAAMCDNNRGVVLMRIGQDVEAAEAYAAATARLERLQHAWPNEARIARDLAVANLNRGRLHYGRSEFIAARQALDAARSTLQSLLTCPADLRATKLHLAATLHAIASLPGEPFEAQKANLLAALELYTRLIAEQHQDVDTLQVAALCYSHLGAMERDQWLTQSNATQVDHDKVSSIPATQAFEQAISLQLKLVRQAPLVLQYRSELAASWNNLGQWQADQGQLATAESSLGKARELLESICTDHPDQLAERSSLGGVLHNLALVLERQQRFAEAVALLEVAISHQQFAADQAPNVTRYREFLAEHLAQFQRLERHASKEGAMSDNHAHDATVQVSVAPERYKGPTP
jgi:tetratricopeptide (TPR) repeat protein